MGLVQSITQPMQRTTNDGVMNNHHDKPCTLENGPGPTRGGCDEEITARSLIRWINNLWYEVDTEL